MTNRITVFIADDHPIFRKGLKTLLEAETDIDIVGEAGTGRETISNVMALQPTVVIMDISMPDIEGLQAASQILHHLPETHILVLSMSADPEYVRHALDVGVKGYLVKESASDDIVTAVREIARGHAFFSPVIAGVLLEIRNGALRERVLTVRERDILQLVAEGKTSKEIADIFHISYRTVEKHRHQIMTKIGVHDTVSLVNYARSKKLIK
jgi:DNA-binding NarL/FixJ family response regulator